MDMGAPCVLPSERPAHGGDERYSPRPSYRTTKVVLSLRVFGRIGPEFSMFFVSW
jgi:hypothetical protein